MKKKKLKIKHYSIKKEGKIGQKNAGIAMEYYTKEIHYNIIGLYSLNKKETEKTKKEEGTSNLLQSHRIVKQV